MRALIKAARLRTLPLALASIIVGTAIAEFFHGSKWLVTGLATLTAVLLQVLSNYANDYGDFVKGTDTEERSDRALASGDLSLDQMRNALMVAAVLSLAVGIALLYVGFGGFTKSFWLMLGLGLICILAAYSYTAGKRAYGYNALGDVAVFIFFGLVAVSGLAFLHWGDAQYGLGSSLIPASAIGLMAAGVLNVNNIRDIEGDKANSKRTLAVVLGKQGAEWYQFALVNVAVLAMAMFIRSQTGNSGLLMILMLTPYDLHWMKLRKLRNSGEDKMIYNKMLKIHVLLNLLTSLVFAFLLLL